MAGFDLHMYCDRFPAVCSAKFGRTYNFSALEKQFQHLREGKNRWLVAKDVEKIFNPINTPFARYWPKPEKDLDKALSEQHIALGPDRPDDGELVRRLLQVLHNIGIVSLILRFVHPKRFGIFSTPIINLLQIHRPNTVELYLAFCHELGKWQQHFEMASVAETEAALWTYSYLSVTTKDIEELEKARRAFDSDVWIQRRRTAQAVTPLIDQHGPLTLARILAEEHPKLAAMIGGVEFERLLRCAAQKLLHFGTTKTAVDTLIDQLVLKGIVLPEQASDLREVWEIRNLAVHPDKPPKPEQVEKIINYIERYCLSWDTESKKGCGQ